MKPSTGKSNMLTAHEFAALFLVHRAPEQIDRPRRRRRVDGTGTDRVAARRVGRTPSCVDRRRLDDGPSVQRHDDRRVDGFEL
jgi:hypothetical protein